MELIYFARRRRRAGKSHKSLNTNKFQPGKLTSRSRSAPPRAPRRPTPLGAGHAGRRRQTARPHAGRSAPETDSRTAVLPRRKTRRKKTPIRTRARGKTKPHNAHAREDGRQPYTHARETERETDSRPTTADGARQSARRRQPDRDADRRRRRSARRTADRDGARQPTHGRQPTHAGRRARQRAGQRTQVATPETHHGQTATTDSRTDAQQADHAGRQTARHAGRAERRRRRQPTHAGRQTEQTKPYKHTRARTRQGDPRTDGQPRRPTPTATADAETHPRQTDGRRRDRRTDRRSAPRPTAARAGARPTPTAPRQPDSRRQETRKTT